MPLNLVGRPKDAVVAVRADSPWRDGVARFLRSLTDDDTRVARHLALLDERLAGRLPWLEVLADATLPDGRPMPPNRRYGEMLVDEERLLLYDVGPLRVSVDLHNPGNEAGTDVYDPSTVELAIVADVRYFSSLAPGSVFDHALGFEEVARRRAIAGAQLGTLVASLFEATHARFAYADISSTGRIARSATNPSVVVHAAPERVRPLDYLWSITLWSPEVLDAKLVARLERLTITVAMLARLDRYERPTYRIERRRLADGALFLQYRFLFGSEGRGTRAAVDTPLAKQAGLRSTHLIYRA